MKNHDLVLGTAGHIDHGKSSLILALTGTDPDRLSEEKQRGITIELGFARLSLDDGTTLGVVDVPGHEKFVRQMISGSTGIDMALLCIAADDGVMPQTTEHLAVLELLRIPTLVVALTKTDLVDDEWVEFMVDEVKGRLAGGPYEGAEIVAVSSRTGEGLDDLKAALGRAAKATKRQKASDSARLPIDRVFTIKGAGTVITGTLWSGAVSTGDELEVLPSGRISRVRSIQIHGESVERAEAGHRVALNLNALSTDEVRPGDFLAAPHTVTATDRFDADFTFLGLPSSDKPLESGTRVHVSHGTREVTGRILRIGDEQGFKSGEQTYAQIRLDEELPVSWQDHFIVRSYSPVHVIGGGVVLRAHPKRSTTTSPEKIALLDALRDGDGNCAAECAFNLEKAPVTCEGIAHAAGCTQKAAQSALESLEKSRKAVRLSSGQAGAVEYFTTPRYVQKMRSAIENALLAFHNENPTSTGISKEALRQKAAARLSADCFDALLSDAQATKHAVVNGGEVCHPQAGAGAQALEKQAAEALLTALREADGSPATLDEIFSCCKIEPALGRRAMASLEKAGEAMRVTKELAFAAEALAQFEQAVRTRLADGASASAAELRDAMGTTRKYAIPLLEYFDDKGITRRSGDERVLTGR